jgi:acylpyruvate hydrolase
MRIIRWSEPGSDARFGLLIDGMVADAGAPEELGLPAGSGAEALLAKGLGALMDLEARAVVRARRPLETVRLLAPFVRPSKIVCVGLNYRAHAQEQGKSAPEKPRLFLKAPSAIVGPGDPIVLPSFCRHGDPEVELAVVIGKRAKRVPAAKAASFIAGYTVLNDFTDRKAQKDDVQYGRAKGFDTFCPIGPALVTKDDVGDPGRLRIRLWVDGELRQDATTADLIHGVGPLLEYITEGITLEPGDIIATGTPSGVGVFRDPPVFIREGQTVRCEVERLGVLENPVHREGA